MFWRCGAFDDFELPVRLPRNYLHLRGGNQHSGNVRLVPQADSRR